MERFNSKGITLVALIITIIVMIILAGVVIGIAIGNDGVIDKAQEAQNTQNYASAKEQALMQIEYLESGTDVGKVNLNTTLTNIQNLALTTDEITSADWTDNSNTSITVKFSNGNELIIKNNGKTEEKPIGDTIDVDGYYYGTISLSYPNGSAAIQIENGYLTAYYLDTNGIDYRFIKWPLIEELTEEAYSSSTTLENLPSGIEEGDKIIMLASQGPMRAYLINGVDLYCMNGSNQIGYLTKTELNNEISEMMTGAEVED